MASDDPDAVVFIIGTNDASIVNTYDSDDDGEPDWEVDYREKIDRMMTTFVGGARHRTVFWLGPPTLGDDDLDRGAEMLGPVMREEAREVRTRRRVRRHVSACSTATTAATRGTLPDADRRVVQMRISDGVHFTVDGAQYLADIALEAARQALGHQRAGRARRADRLHDRATGSNDYVPGVGRYRPSIELRAPTPDDDSTAPTRRIRLERPTRPRPSPTASSTIARHADDRVAPTTKPPTSARRPPRRPHAARRPRRRHRPDLASSTPRRPGSTS